MIRGQIELSDDLFRSLTKLPEEMIEWLRQAQEQLRTIPAVIHYQDLTVPTFPEADDYTLLYMGFDVYLKDTEWYSLRGGVSHSVGDTLPSAFEPVVIDYTAMPIGTTRTLYNNSGAIINAGATASSSVLRSVRIQAAGMVSDVSLALPAGSNWYSFAKLSAGEAGDFVRVS